MAWKVDRSIDSVFRKSLQNMVLESVARLEALSVGEFTFLENCVRRPDSDDLVRATGQEWNLIRAVLCHGAIHWIEGFLVFDTWRNREQNRDYLPRFQTIASRASLILRKNGFRGKIASVAGSPGFYGLDFGFEKPPETSIGRSLELLRRSRKLFAQDDDSAWRLLIDSVEGGVDAGNLCQSLVYATHLPEVVGCREEGLNRVKSLLQAYRSNLIDAVVRVSDKASSQKSQGVTFEIAAEPIARWLSESAAINQIDELFGGRELSTALVQDTDAQQFADLASELTECLDDLSCHGRADGIHVGGIVKCCG